MALFCERNYGTTIVVFVLTWCYDNFYFTKQILVDKKLNRNNNIELDSENTPIHCVSIKNSENCSHRNFVTFLGYQF